MNPPKISVVMPVWNGEQYLCEAIDSILNQTFKDFEFIILDDGSTDETPSILDEYAKRDSRIRIIPLDHQGIVIALNQGVDAARADWVARMDCDDISHHNRLEKQWKAIQQAKYTVLCHSGFEYIGEIQEDLRTPRLVRTKSLLKLRLCSQSPIVHPTVMFRKDAFLAVGGYRKEERHAEDFGLWGRLQDLGTVVGFAESLLKFRIHQQSISKQKMEEQASVAKAIALRHCQQFLGLDKDQALRAWNTLRYKSTDSPFKNWFWLMAICICRLRPLSLETLMWLFKNTACRVLFSLK